jgi:hypothetical protein
MMEIVHAQAAGFFAAAATKLSLVLLLYLLPFLVFVWLARFSWVLRSLLTTTYAALVLTYTLLGRWELIPWIWGGSLYYLLAAVVVFRLPPLLRKGKITHGGLFAALAFVLLVLPNTLVPETASLAFLITGWELLFSSYSYVTEVARTREHEPRLARCLTFLLVNPMLVYSATVPSPVRGARSLRFLVQVGYGLLALVFAATVLYPLRTVLLIPAAQGSWLMILLDGATRAVAGYAGHGGLAAIRVGLMRSMGAQVPDCFNNPFLSRNPVDFWRRWNRYLGSWLEKYIFRPTAKWFHGVNTSWGRFWGAQAVPLAFGATLMASGLLHDLFSSTRSFEVSLIFTRQFSLVAAFSLLWAVADRGLGRLPHALPTASEPLDLRASLEQVVTSGRQLLARTVTLLGFCLLPVFWGAR